eukprot:4571635-Amphidinium_carterae.1
MLHCRSAVPKGQGVCLELGGGKARRRMVPTTPSCNAYREALGALGPVSRGGDELEAARGEFPPTAGSPK